MLYVWLKIPEIKAAVALSELKLKYQMVKIMLDMGTGFSSSGVQAIFAANIEEFP